METGRGGAAILMAALGWLVITALGGAFLLAGWLCHIGASDRPASQAWRLLALGLAFGTISVVAFPF